MSEWTNKSAGADYDDARPAWPAVVGDFLASLAPAGGWSVVLDLAAGTGKLTERLVGVADRIIAVEPSQVLLHILRERVPEAEAVAGSAEAIPVGDATIELLVAGNAFHWFDPRSVAEEASRVLCPEGIVAALWHLPEWPSWFPALLERLAPYQSAESARSGRRFQSGDWRSGLEEKFGQLTAHPLAKTNMRWSHEEFVQVMASTSHIAALDDTRRNDALRVARAFIADRDQPIVVSHRVEVEWARA